MTRAPRIGRVRPMPARDGRAGTALAHSPGVLARAFLVLFLALALAPVSLGCGTSKHGASNDASSTPDGRAHDAPSCVGKPAVGCVVGAPSDAGGVWCQGFVMPATCRDGQWSCPSGMVFGSDCTCGEPGLSCASQICTAAGPVCLDAGATPDGPSDGPPCADASFFYCSQGTRNGDIGICGDVTKPAACVGGQWTCPTGAINTDLCTCAGPVPAGCVCSSHGWSCDAGVPSDARLDGGGSDASCDVGCAPSTPATFCQASEVQWTCQNAGWAAALFRASCRDAGTDIQRFCCPGSFLTQCR
jgi:hypothetical protein